MLCFFQWFVVSGQSKSRPVKAAGAEVRAQQRNQKLHAAVAKRTFASQNVQKTSCSEHFLKLRCLKIVRRCGETRILQVKMYKTRQLRSTFWSWDVQKLHAAVAKRAFCKSKCTKHVMLRSTFWSWDVEKLHAAVAKRTFASENVQNTSCSEHFLKLRCRKIARRCGETRISQLKMLKNWRSRSTFWSSDVQKLPRRCGETHICKWKCTKYLCFRTLFEVQMSKISQLASSSVNQSVR